ncbi:MAG: hypothetical protein QME58_04470 [Bacteroidota bacterium]|nr:hypothetical protein [Bacteroidota bacterium]
MANVLFIISYEIKPDKRGEYLNLIKNLSTKIKQLGMVYDVYEKKGKTNYFNEVYSCKSMDEIDNLEDSFDEKTQELISVLAKLVKGKMTYQTLIGLD